MPPTSLVQGFHFSKLLGVLNGFQCIAMIARALLHSYWMFRMVFGALPCAVWCVLVYECSVMQLLGVQNGFYCVILFLPARALLYRLVTGVFC